MLPNRRFIKTHEQILLSRWFSLALGWLVVVLIPYMVLVGSLLTEKVNDGHNQALYISTTAFLVTYYGIKRFLLNYPGGKSVGLLVTHVLITYAVIAFVVLFFRLEFSRLLLLTSTGMALAWFYIEYRLTNHYKRTKLAVINKGFASRVLPLQSVDARLLTTLDLGTVRYDGIVADFTELNADEERFLTNCVLRGIPVYNAKNIYESVTGRVRIDHMSENNIGALLPSPTLERFKTLLDFLFVMITAPLILPLCLITAIAIRLESPGPVIYTQTRVGKGNKPFTIYKLRSMRFDLDAPQQFAGEADPRITRIGRFIRKSRIDELPQFLNILKGDMSLIGPRPEQPDFVKAFDKKIPFYSYRHVIKPGITGWAQVRYGYAADVSQNQVKIEHDFFYIKNYSLLLDIFIVLLTIRTMVTGFGAR